MNEAALFGAPAVPPAEWFEKPDWLAPAQRLTITDDGQVAGYFYAADTCLVPSSSERECWQPAPSPTGYAAFHQGMVVCADNTELQVGCVGKAHAPAYGTALSAVEFNNNPDRALIIARAGDDEHGGWIAGALLPKVTDDDVAMMRRTGLSGDWRWFFHHPTSRGEPWPTHGRYDCIGPAIVNRPGLPLPVAASVSDPPAIVGTNLPCPCEDCEDTMTIQAAVIGATDLPIDTESTWDATAADERVRAWASSDDSGEPDTIDWDAYAQAFFYRDDDADAESFDAYGLPFADVADGDLTAVAAGLRAVASRLPQADIPEDERDEIAERVDAYLDRIDDEDDESASVQASVLTVGRTPEGRWQVHHDGRHVDCASRRAAFAFAGRAGLTVQAAADDGPAFVLDPMVIENEWTRDYRMIEEAWWDEERLPMSLFAQTELGWGHEGAVLVGRIDTITRDGSNLIGRGVFGTWEEATDVADQVRGGYLRGVSIDGGQAEDVRLVFPEESGPDEIEDTAEEGGELEMEPMREIVGRLEIAGATLCAHAAFGDAQVRLDEPEGAEPEPALAALGSKLDYLIGRDTRARVAALDAEAPTLGPDRLARRVAAVDGHAPALP